MDKAEFLISEGYGDMLEGMSPIEIEELFNSVTGAVTAANTYREPGNQGGRVGFQTGGTTVSQQLQPEYIEALGKTYAADLTRQAGIPSITQATAQMPGETASQFQQRKAQAEQFDITQQSMGALAPQVAAQDPMQAAAYAQATDPTYGLGAYQPYTADARTAAQAAGALTGTGAGAATTAGTIASYMSPYQQDVIDTTMTEFDEQALRQKATQAANALGTPGAFGGGREGVLQAQYATQSDRNRAAMLGGLRQQGYTQASAARQADMMARLGIGGAQQQYAQGLAGFAGQRAGLGAQQAAMAQQQLGLGGAQTGLAQSYQQLAGLAPQLAAQEISGLGSLGAVRQAQSQAVLDAQRQAAQTAAYEPMQRAGFFGSQVTGLMGGYPARYQFTQQPEPSPLSSALQAGTGLASIFGNIALGKKLWG